MSRAVPLPRAVHDFVLRYIDSVTEVEALLLLHGDAELPWSSATVARRLYVDDGTAQQLLLTLHGRGLLVRDGLGFRYDPCHIDVRAGIDALAACYPRFLIEIAHIIHAKSGTGSGSRAQRQGSSTND